MKRLCIGSMRAGRAELEASACVLTCALCGRRFVRSMRPHTRQVPRHLAPPRVVMHRRRRYPTARPGFTMAGVCAVAAEMTSPGGGDPPTRPLAPPCIWAGDVRLNLTGGDFPGEIVYWGRAHGAEAWIKGPTLAGPWDWIVTRESMPADFGGPCARRDDATGELAECLAGLGLAPPPLEPVEAAPAVPAPAAALGADPELIGLALDLAIAALRKARRSFPGAVESAHGR